MYKMLVIIPEGLREHINIAIDRELVNRPCDTESRKQIYSQLLSFYSKYGVIPEFTLVAKEAEQCAH